MELTVTLDIIKEIFKTYPNKYSNLIIPSILPPDYKEIFDTLYIINYLEEINKIITILHRGSYYDACTYCYLIKIQKYFDIEIAKKNLIFCDVANKLILNAIFKRIEMIKYSSQIEGYMNNKDRALHFLSNEYETDTFKNKIDALKSEIVNLKNQLHYVPGNSGFIEAQTEFNSLK